MKKLTTVVLRHRALVTLAWIVLTVVGGLLVGKANSGLSHTQATPGLAGYEANQAMIRRLGLDGGEAPVIAVLRLPHGQTMARAAGQAAAARTFAAAAKLGHVGLIDYATTHDRRLVSADGNTTWALLDMPNPDAGPYTNTQHLIEPALRRAAPPGAAVTITGNEALQSTGSGAGAGLSTLTETLIGAGAALLVLGFAYGSAIAVVPLLMALPSILTTFLLVYGLEQVISISSLVQYLVAFVGLGISIDYSLLIVTRWREERERGLDSREAIITAGEHAGRAVVLSGAPAILGTAEATTLPPARRLAAVLRTAAGNTTAGTDTVTRLRNALDGQPGAIRVGGDTAANIDFTNAIYGNFAVMLAAIALITFVLLARSFRSVALAAKAVVLNLISLGASFGFIVLFWQQGRGSGAIYGIAATHAIRNWIPIIMFAFLFGISMDYEVFVLARMREEYDATGDTRRAIVGAVARTGRLITCAALILAHDVAAGRARGGREKRRRSRLVT